VAVSVGARGTEQGLRLFTGAFDGYLVPDDLPDGFVAADARGVVRCFNTAASALTGILGDKALGRSFDEVLPFRDTSGRDWWRCTDPYGGLAIRKGHPEVRLLLPGSECELLVTSRYVRKNGPATQVTGLVVSLRSSAARRRADRQQADLIATVAHELRSPLTSVKGFTATLLNRWHRFTDDQKQMMLHTVDADADRVVRLIAELLDVARLDSGRLELHRIPVDLASLVTSQVAACVAGGVDTDRFEIRIPAGLPAVYADPDKLRQVLANLLENAVRHGTGTVIIEAEAEIDQAVPNHTGSVQTVAVAVSDEGPGIPEDQLDRVFTRFWRGGRRGGTGLGLSIVKGLVEAHGGTVAVDRSPAGGARFRFTLPVAS
jgi:signal transduction histidine kinase